MAQMVVRLGMPPTAARPGFQVVRRAVGTISFPLPVTCTRPAPATAPFTALVATTL